MTQLVFGGEQAERVELRFDWPPLSKRQGWLETFVDITVKGFTGSIRASIEADDLRRFRAQLETLYQTLRGGAELNPREGQIVLLVQANGRGGMTVKGTAFSEATYGNKLEFELALDQTFLAEPIRVLRGISA